MKRVINILGLVFAIATTILSTTKYFSYSFIPLIATVMCWLSLLFMSKRSGENNKYLQYIGLLVIIASGLAVFNSMTFDPSQSNHPQRPQVPVLIDSSSTASA